MYRTFYFQDEEELFEAEAEKRNVQQEYKEILVWLNDVEEKASLMAQQWSEDVEEDEPRKKRKAVRYPVFITLRDLGRFPKLRTSRPDHGWSSHFDKRKKLFSGDFAEKPSPLCLLFRI